ncbi:MAG: DUF616 domain-containing protein [Lachnospiraceae bacterium]|nr:DUF616 domain-containing protein [Lachnospiraceae bacterium]
MEGFDDIEKLIRTVLEYLEAGKMSPAQVPYEDISAFAHAGIETVNIDASSITNDCNRLFSDLTAINDTAGVCALIRLILTDHQVVSELYKDRISKIGLGNETVPLRVELEYYKNLERNRIAGMGKQESVRPAFTGKGAVYCAVTGGYDAIREPLFIDPDLDYYLFTDSDNVSSDLWKVIKVGNPEGLDPVKLARKIKILGCYDYLSDYDYTVWLDGKLQVTGDLKEYINRYSKGNGMLCFNHYVSDDAYSEAKTCIMLNKDDPGIINAQMDRYRKEGLPEHSGLIDSCMLIRDNRDETVRNTMKDWWNEILHGSRRDQLSFNYACFKNKTLYDTSPLISYSNEYLKTYSH